MRTAISTEISSHSRRTVDRLQNWLPPTAEIRMLFFASVFPTHLWAIINTFREVPAYILRLNVLEIAAIFAYTLLFALVESLVISALLVVLGLILPSRFFKDYFLGQGALFLFITAIWVIPVHYRAHIVQGLSISLPLFIFLLWLWVTSYAGLCGAAYLLIRRRPKFRDGIRAFLDRLAILSLFYLLLDLVSLLLVIFRNVI